ncbi:DUF1302 family protein [Abyssogena phaseoliformis symbiont]|uniref:DUF1302 family protein n=1 Tax=Abyssogena phaseoliformis symbiont TaxID=596095 RepID=UPI001916B6F0|nr:DUF1302 family protein [Abyssogena phaseoliformis symbiont]
MGKTLSVVAVLKETTIKRKRGNEAVWVIESLLNNQAIIDEADYTKSILYVRKDNYVLVRAKFYLKKSKRVKCMDVRKLAQINGIWVAMQTTMTTTPKGYKHELNLNELILEGSINPKIGRQIVVWGRSDSIRITDVLNPLDNRMPGLVGIKNLRLGRLMSKLDYYFDKLNLSMIVLHENRFSKTAAYGSDFKISADKPVNKPSNALDNTGVALSFTGIFEGYDL